ncbi:MULTISPECIES: DUF1289 domain-containing protein [Alphaproteobacteria]|uniref:DUF1289 domain-containing protein n=2 Tax=Sphingomonadales TaxID=204457 RepID=A0A5J5HSM7_9SPHN|nr:MULTISPECIES: DUF1289 domain-containing protein [Alphaproteobacteria]KAA9011685.1 DUF1289 domain-containing protein [Sphingobium limneticum]KAA9024269.1 DUF1289 domain-containing protein [Sphingobium limneticum]MBN9146149.1 DUF1289 domain-containing protein [Novosphingobium sp.]MEC6701558.1 DUF1289 domain-containing protein [Sphingobium sp. SJ10-10]PTD24627.1 DUF1289 domain-containing protein [Sphingomonas fennica]
MDLCRFDGTTGWCRGCGRSKPECRAWKKAQPQQQRKIAADLPRRLAKLAGRELQK